MGKGLRELLARRRELKGRIDSLIMELEAVDRVLFARIDKLSEAIEGVGVNMAAFENKTRGLESMRANLRDMKTLHFSPLTNAATAATAACYYKNLRNSLVHGGSATREATASYVADNLLRAAEGVLESSALGRLVPLVTQILEDAGRPMRTGAIHRALIERGFVMPGKNPPNNLAAHLSNNRDAFLSTSDGWVLRSPSLIHNDTRESAESEG
jgi:hypothetical protein